VHRRAFLTWVAVYPTITVALLLLRPVIGGLPVAVQTLVLTAVVVPPVIYYVLPALLRLDARLARRRSV
jgi:antibiotic biosynthesis monooxygenase (ABM) superfamily enzyme